MEDPCISCDSQQSLMMYLIFVILQAIFLCMNFFELLTNRPTQPIPVGISPYDYRTLSPFQWQEALIVNICCGVVYAVELLAGFQLYHHLSGMPDDKSYSGAFALNYDSERETLLGGWQPDSQPVANGASHASSHITASSARARAPVPARAERSDIETGMAGAGHRLGGTSRTSRLLR